jgi:hypothetical protein
MKMGVGMLQVEVEEGGMNSPEPRVAVYFNGKKQVTSAPCKKHLEDPVSKK